LNKITSKEKKKVSVFFLHSKEVYLYTYVDVERTVPFIYKKKKKKKTQKKKKIKKKNYLSKFEQKNFKRKKKS